MYIFTRHGHRPDIFEIVGWRPGKGQSSLLSYRYYCDIEILSEVRLSVTISTDKYACFDITAVRSVPAAGTFYTNGTGIKFSRSYLP